MDSARAYALKNQATDEIVASEVVRPHGWIARSFGLLKRKRLDANQGLWLNRCWGIHTVGMRFNIDVLFLDAAFRIISVRPNVRPGRLAVAQANAEHVIELAAGTSERFDLLPGDRMALVEISDEPAAPISSAATIAGPKGKSVPRRF